MTLIWITLAFVAGAFCWHYIGGLLLRKVGLGDSLRSDLIRNLSTDTLLKLMRESKREFDRRAALMEELGG